MAAIRDLSVSLPADLVDMVHHKVAAGEYATPSDVIGEGLRALQAQERDETEWLQTRIGPVYDRMIVDPSAALSVSDVRHALRVTTAGDV
ncbi:type II toxin-antitoxin system ParD family antitoxin [Methylobacterium sp. 10]|uniref:ribbon-helix-helix domain-containing protein n=1 Tax=Methylobacterium sp. 10 TaxID=1101191 RepID=UPI000485A4A9|nr:type II toxin-antitoxin system ParD family antitoxin [Methylobacterium sp. 10]